MNDFLCGMRLALPVVLGYLPVGFAFGVLAVQAGMNPLLVGLMSYFVYAGSAQLIAADLLTAGASTATVIVTTFVVNLRHLLMSAALTPYLQNWSKARLAWFSFEMTDETFAANLGRFASHGVNKGEALGLNFIAHMGWVVGGVAGALFDSVIGDVKPFGLDFALPGMFIALLLPHFHVPRRLLAACFGAAFSLFFAVIGAEQWDVMLATACAATIAAFWPESARGEAMHDYSLLILGMAGVTYIPRMAPLMLLSSRNLNPRLMRWLEMVPPAVLAALLAPELLLGTAAGGGKSLFISANNIFLLAALPTFVLGWITKSFFGTITFGMGMVALLRYLL